MHIWRQLNKLQILAGGVPAKKNHRECFAPSQRVLRTMLYESKHWRFSSKGPSVEKLRLAQQRRRITLWAPTIEVNMLYESLLDTKPNKENGPWPLLGTLVEPDRRSEKSHFSWKCDSTTVFQYSQCSGNPWSWNSSKLKKNEVQMWFWTGSDLIL